MNSPSSVERVMGISQLKARVKGCWYFHKYQCSWPQRPISIDLERATAFSLMAAKRAPAGHELHTTKMAGRRRSFREQCNTPHRCLPLFPASQPPCPESRQVHIPDKPAVRAGHRPDRPAVRAGPQTRQTRSQDRPAVSDRSRQRFGGLRHTEHLSRPDLSEPSADQDLEGPQYSFPEQCNSRFPQLPARKAKTSLPSSSVPHDQEVTTCQNISSLSIRSHTVASHIRADVVNSSCRHDQPAPFQRD